MSGYPSLVINFNLLQGYIYVSKLPPSVCLFLLSTLVRVTEEGEFLKDQLRWLEGHGDKVATALALDKEEMKTLSLNEQLNNNPIYKAKGTRTHGNNRAKK